MSIRINVAPSNPGQFFDCCGLLELADRLWPGAEGWFEQRYFCIGGDRDLAHLIHQASHAKLTQLDMQDSTSSPLVIGPPFDELRLDWWQDEQAGGRELK